MCLENLLKMPFLKSPTKNAHGSGSQGGERGGGGGSLELFLLWSPFWTTSGTRSPEMAPLFFGVGALEPHFLGPEPRGRKTLTCIVMQNA